MTTIRLPWPDKALSSNSRAHWSVRGRAASKARLGAFYACKAEKVPKGKSAKLTFTFHPKERGRLPDLANCPHMCKAYIDGIADAVGCDDAHFTPIWPEELGERRKGGEVVVKIEVTK